jgi:hypothetical protein
MDSATAYLARVDTLRAPGGTLLSSSPVQASHCFMFMGVLSLYLDAFRCGKRR